MIRRLALVMFTLLSILFTPATAYILLSTAPATAIAAGRKGPTLDDTVVATEQPAAPAAPLVAATPCPMGKYLFETSPKSFLGADGLELVLTDHPASMIGKEYGRMCFSIKWYIQGVWVIAPDGTQKYVEGKWTWSEPLLVLNNVHFEGAFAVSGKWYFTFSQRGEGYDFVVGFNPATRQFSHWPYMASSPWLDWYNLPEGSSGKNSDR